MPGQQRGRPARRERRPRPWSARSTAASSTWASDVPATGAPTVTRVSPVPADATVPVRTDPAVQQAGGLQGRFETSALSARQFARRGEVHQAPQRGAWPVPPGFGGPGVRGARAALAAGPQLGQLRPQGLGVFLGRLPAQVQRRPARGQFGAGCRGGLLRCRACRIGARQCAGPLGEFVQQTLGVGRAQERAGREVLPDRRQVVPALFRRVLVGVGTQLGPAGQFGVRVRQLPPGPVQRPYRLLHGGQPLLDQGDRAHPSVGESSAALRWAVAGVSSAVSGPTTRSACSGSSRAAAAASPARFSAVCCARSAVSVRERAAPSLAVFRVSSSMARLRSASARSESRAVRCGQLGGLLQLAGAAHLRAGPQRVVPGP